MGRSFWHRSRNEIVRGHLLVRAMDLFHVAIAIEAGADALLSFDADQIALAKAAGLPVLGLRQNSR